MTNQEMAKALREIANELVGGIRQAGSNGRPAGAFRTSKDSIHVR